MAETRIRLPSSICFDVQPLGQIEGQLLASERPLLKGATLTRRRELVAGRVLAHRLMEFAGFAVRPVLTRTTGAPIWPSGLCGSIAHSSNAVAVALAPLSEVHSLGIDIEDGRELGAAATDIGDGDEFEAVMRQGVASSPSVAARILFSAKEALFKCQSAVTGDVDLGFADVRVQLDASGRLRGVPSPLVRPEISDIIDRSSINIIELQGVMVVFAWLPASDYLV